MESITLTPAMVAAMPVITFLLFVIKVAPIPENLTKWFQWISMLVCGPVSVWITAPEDMTVKAIIASGFVVGGVAVGLFEGAKKAVTTAKELVE